ncbi:MAG: hypothetical protein PVJ80_09800 [Gemmatimonadota bacterium]
MPNGIVRAGGIEERAHPGPHKLRLREAETPGPYGFIDGDPEVPEDQLFHRLRVTLARTSDEDILVRGVEDGLLAGHGNQVRKAQLVEL